MLVLAVLNLINSLKFAMILGFLGAHTIFCKGIFLSDIIGIYRLILLYKIRHFRMSKNKTVVATILCPFLARPHKTTTSKLARLEYR